MKKLFSSLLLSLALLPLSAQTTRVSTATFDFLRPGTLSPALAIDSLRSSTPVTDITFTDGPVHMCVTVTGLNSTNPSLHEDDYRGEKVTDLWSFKGNTLTVTCDAGYELLSVAFSNDTQVGGYGLAAGSPGKFDEYNKWSNTASDGSEISGIRSVALYNSQRESHIQGINVTYRSPLNVLRTVAVTPLATEELTSLSQMTLTFDKAIASFANTPFAVKNGTTVADTLGAPSVNGKSVTISTTKPFTAGGTYTVAFPDKSFITAEGYYNKAFTASFTIKEPQNTFMPEPVPGGLIDVIQKQYTLTFPTAVGNMPQLASLTLDVYRRGEAAPCGYAKFKQGDDDKTVIMTIGGVSYTQPTVFTISVPEKTFYNYLYGDDENPALRWNAAFEMKFWKEGVETPSAEVVARATDVLKHAGVGYPSATSASRTALASMIETQDVSDAKFEAAIAAFYAETDITLPETGKHYTATSVQANGSELYLSYDGNAVTLSTDKSKAYAFEATATAGGYTLTTADGKYLNVLVASDHYTSARATNLAEAATPLAIAKLAGDDAQATFGLMTMSGNIGKYYNAGADVTAFSTVSPDGGIAEGIQAAFFSSELSSAFRFEEAAKPEVVTAYALTINPALVNGTVEQLESITITFTNATGIAYDNTKAITVTGSGAAIAATNVTVSGTDNNVVTITFPGLRNDTYTFTAPEGAFTWEKDGATVSVPAISTEFRVYSADDFITDLATRYTLVQLVSLGNRTINPSDLNAFAIEVQDHQNNYAPIDVYPSDEELIIERDYSEVTRGHFVREVREEKYNVDVVFQNGVEKGDVRDVVREPNTGEILSIKLTNGSTVWTFNPSTDSIKSVERVRYHYVLRLALDELIQPTAKAGLYQIVMPEAAFGDALFARYMAGEAVQRKQCHVNGKFTWGWNADPKVAATTGITTVATEAARAEGIYDLSGRRVAKAAKPGLYIIGGRKVVVK